MNDDRDWLEAFSIFHFKDGRPRPWAVTADDCDPGRGHIATFATKAEAEAFVIAEQRQRSATAPL